MHLDPFSDEALLAANPAAGHFLSLDELRGPADRARSIPSEENEYRNFTLNQRVSAHSPFLSRNLWMGCADEPEDLTGVPVYVGLDLSESHDLTARVLVGERDGAWSVHPRFWLPEHDLDKKAAKDRQPYDLWAKGGHLSTTPGKVIDYAFIAEDLRDLCQTHDVRRVFYDPRMFAGLMPSLRALGFTEAQIDGGLFEAMKQQGQHMTAPLREVETLFLEEKVRHGNHPVLEMCAKKRRYREEIRRIPHSRQGEESWPHRRHGRPDDGPGRRPAPQSRTGIPFRVVSRRSRRRGSLHLRRETPKLPPFPGEKHPGTSSDGTLCAQIG